MFRALLGRIGVTNGDAPIFHLYLHRHVHLDEGFHAPFLLRRLNALCAGDPEKESQAAAEEAVQHRVEFWDGVAEAIRANRKG